MDIADDEWAFQAILKQEPHRTPEGVRVHDRPNREIIKNIEAMLLDPDRWHMPDPAVKHYVHDTGVWIRLRIVTLGNMKRLGRCILVGFGDMPPFKIEPLERDTVEIFHATMALRNARPTIEKVGTLAALCR